jgi:periplasmic divalent cation tolerance protein
MNDQPIVVYVTAPSKEVGRQIAQALLEQQLAACVNILPAINSLYIWNGEVCDDEEVLLIIKSRAALFTNHLIPAIQAIHPYQIPEIIALPVTMGLDRYLEWIQQVTRPASA